MPSALGCEQARPERAQGSDAKSKAITLPTPEMLFHGLISEQSLMLFVLVQHHWVSGTRPDAGAERAAQYIMVRFSGLRVFEYLPIMGSAGKPVT
jgi:hypothetical protein